MNITFDSIIVPAEAPSEAAPQAGQPWEDITIPEFARTFVKFQKLSANTPRAKADQGRKFSAAGPKADICVKMLLAGGWTRSQIATTAGCSVSRVAEVVWVCEAAGLAISYNTK